MSNVRECVGETNLSVFEVTGSGDLDAITAVRDLIRTRDRTVLSVTGPYQSPLDELDVGYTVVLGF